MGVPNGLNHKDVFNAEVVEGFISTTKGNSPLDVQCVKESESTPGDEVFNSEVVEGFISTTKGNSPLDVQCVKESDYTPGDEVQDDNQ